MANNTKKVKAYLSIRKGTDSTSTTPSFSVNFTKEESWRYYAHYQLAEVDIEVPDLSNNEMDMLCAGALLESVIAERARYKEESMVQLAMLDARIEELKCIEYKGDNR